VPETLIGVPNLAFLLDIDGTLLDLAPTPRDVRVPTSLRHTLERLQARSDGAVALVSGRSLADIDLIFHPLHLSAIGGHGAEIRYHANGHPDQRLGASLDDELKRRLAEIAASGRGIIVEDKGYSLALHYRLAPEKKQAVWDAVDAVIADLPPKSVEILPGKAVIEIKKSGFDKGTAIRELMRKAPFSGRRPVFVGDDTTDEAAFRVLPEFNGVGISVGRLVPGVSRRFETPTDVRRWLERIAKTNGSRQA
jgi:trehalose 6-phosphate phosphatase